MFLIFAWNKEKSAICLRVCNILSVNYWIIRAITCALENMRFKCITEKPEIEQPWVNCVLLKLFYSVWFFQKGPKLQTLLQDPDESMRQLVPFRGSFFFYKTVDPWTTNLLRSGSSLLLSIPLSGQGCTADLPCWVPFPSTNYIKLFTDWHSFFQIMQKQYAVGTRECQYMHLRVQVVTATLPATGWKGMDFFGHQMACDAISKGPKRSRFPGPNPLPLALVMDLPASKPSRTGRINHRSINS